jgi:hypothetical protein
VDHVVDQSLEEEVLLLATDQNHLTYLVEVKVENHLLVAGHDHLEVALESLLEVGVVGGFGGGGRGRFGGPRRQGFAGRGGGRGGARIDINKYISKAEVAEEEVFVPVHTFNDFKADKLLLTNLARLGYLYTFTYSRSIYTSRSRRS